MTRPRWKARAAACVLVALLGGCDDKHDEAPPVRPVLSTIVAPQAERTLGFSGTIQPRYSVDLGFRVLGRMISRNVEVGDQVKAAAVLAAIDATQLELAVRSSIADVETARAQLSNASGSESRQTYLRGRGVSSQAQLETAQQSQDSASATLERAEANLAKAREQLTYAQLRSDMDGVVTAVSAQAGQVVAAGQAVVTVARPDVREASVDVPEDVASALKPGVKFEIALQLDPSIHVPGEVREIAPQADATTRTRRVLITLAEPKEIFRLGTTITATLTTPSAATTDLPRSALLERDGKDFVWVFDPARKTVAMREVSVSRRDAGTFRVASGLDPGARVVTAGVHSLKPDQQVKILDEAAP